ncbi:hypothetical protein H4219_002015 [Mycoemilia scoparia]|uniref:Golgi to ER traffic protein 4 homolog n=1 Tax=Mycoemilia scoparia TaxID=417184 RepID=A0A9W7ZYL9_9FUNG|nr:hypothetical protein H4219_002015 [Mycoemilia scoparia]
MQPTTKKLESTLKVLNGHLEAKQFYEAHQVLRSVAIRFMKKQDYDNAIELVYTGALELANYDQWNSVADLISLLLEIYTRSHVKVENESKDRLYDLLQDFPSSNKSVFKVTEAAIKWSINEGNSPLGDPELHHFFGSFYRTGGQYEKAEKHYFFGTKLSPVSCGVMMLDWAQECNTTEYGLFAARGVLGYLLVDWFGGAVSCFNAFLKAFKERSIQSVEQRTIGKSDLTTSYVSSQPILNFCNLILQTVERSDGNPSSKATELFIRLRNEYCSQFGENEGCICRSLDKIGEIYFGLVPSRPQNPFADIMSGLFGNGGGANAPVNNSSRSSLPGFSLD